MSPAGDGCLLGWRTGHSLRGNWLEMGCSMLFALAGFLLLIWLASLALKVTVGAIHLLLVLAVVLFVIGFIRGRTGRTPA